ncbi:MAG: hypothetical protein RL211_2369 [Pseudomonadota bacterium]|jgi:hypothetical protein
MSDFTTAELESATSGAAFVATQIAKIFGPIPQAGVTLLMGEVAWTTAAVDLGAKMSFGEFTLG